MDERDVIELLAKILIEGRGGGIISPTDPQFGIGGAALPGSSNRSRRGAATTSSRSRSAKVGTIKRTRKVSAYQKRFGMHLKRLKKAHPRTDISQLMKKAHRATRRDMK